MYRAEYERAEARAALAKAGVTRWTRIVRAESYAQAADVASKLLKPKAGQAVWVDFVKVER